MLVEVCVCVFKSRSEWDERVLYELVRSGQWFNSPLIPRSQTVGRVVYTGARLVTLECTGGVIRSLYHCRRSGRDRQCERGGRGIRRSEIRGAGTVGPEGSNDPLGIYLGVKHGILTPLRAPDFLERNISWYTPTRSY